MTTRLSGAVCLHAVGTSGNLTSLMSVCLFVCLFFLLDLLVIKSNCST